MADNDVVEGEQTQKNTPDDENIVADALEWGEVDSQAMLVALIKLGSLMTAGLVGSNEKTLPASYATWSKMTDMQKNKTMKWWRNCSEAGKTALNVIAKTAAKEKATTDKEKAAKTHKNDLCRLFSLRKDAGMQGPSLPYHNIPYYPIPYHTLPYHTIPYYTIQICRFCGRRRWNA